jgi:uncharacterized protein YhfF
MILPMNDTNIDNKVGTLLQQAGLPADTSWEARLIGADEAMVELILGVMASGEKSMTFSLPWLSGSDDPRPPAVGSCLVALGFDGQPRLLLQFTEVLALNFGEVGAQHLAREGIPMRDPVAWKALHTAVWNQVMAPLGKSVSDDMPVWAEYFELKAVA